MMKYSIRPRSLSLSLLACILLTTVSCGRTQSKKNETKQQEIIERRPTVIETQPKKQVEKVQAIERIVHQAHLSDGWYNHNQAELTASINDYLDMAQSNFYVEANPESVRALIVPHAGHYYSGLCASTAYQTLLSTKNLNSPDIKNRYFTRVIVLAPSHQTFFTGVALPDYTTYKTALGTVDVDTQVISKLAKNGLFKKMASAHDPEHAVEIQLPFLQQTIDNFQLVPLVIGHLNEETLENIAKVIKPFITNQTLVVVSSDFMHHGDNYEYNVFSKNIVNQIRFIDSLALEAIARQSLPAFEKVLQDTGSTICGQNPIKIFIELMNNGSFGAVEPRFTCYYSSPQLQQARVNNQAFSIPSLFGAVADKNAHASVSYASMIFTSQSIDSLKKENQLTGYEKQALITMVRQTLENNFKPENQRLPDHLLWPIVTPGLQQTRGAFVTLNTEDGKLRGCIGQVASGHPLYQTIQDMGKAAAFRDTRFVPVSEAELKNLVIDITILSPSEKISSLYEIQLGKHGIILKKFQKDGTLKAEALFLPQVPTSFGWDLRTTMAQLSAKAGLDADGWKEGCEIEIFEGFMIKEE